MREKNRNATDVMTLLNYSVKIAPCFSVADAMPKSIMERDLQSTKESPTLKEHPRIKLRKGQTKSKIGAKSIVKLMNQYASVGSSSAPLA